MRVIVRTSGDDPYWIGEYQGVDETCFNLPIVVNDAGDVFFVCGLIMPYSDKLKAWLDTMTAREQWDTLVAIKRFWDEKDKLKRNST